MAIYKLSWQIGQGSATKWAVRSQTSVLQISLCRVKIRYTVRRLDWMAGFILHAVSLALIDGLKENYLLSLIWPIRKKMYVHIKTKKLRH